MLNAIAYTMDEIGLLYKSYVNEFNRYSNEMNLDIEVNLILMTSSNSTESLVNNGAMFESLLKKKNTKYDIFFYDGTVSQNYGPYLVDLNTVIPKVQLDMYNKNILSQVSEYKDKIVGLVSVFFYQLFLFIDILYCIFIIYCYFNFLLFICFFFSPLLYLIMVYFLIKNY